MALTTECTHGEHTLMAKPAPTGTIREHTSPAVELRVRSDVDHLAVLRAVAATIALRQDFDLDTVEDVKLAVDEAATRLIAISADDATLTCLFRVAGDGLVVTLTAPTRPGTSLDRTRSFGWRVLESLTDALSVSTETDSDGAPRTTVTLSVSPGSAAR